MRVGDPARRASLPSHPGRCRRRSGRRSRPSPRSRRRSRTVSHLYEPGPTGSPTGSARGPRCRGSSVGCIPKTPTPPRTSDEVGSLTSCDHPTTKISSGSSAATAANVSSELTSLVSCRTAPRRPATSSNEHCPERLGSIGPGSVTTPTISAPTSAAASRQSRPIVSKLTQTVRIAARWYSELLRRGRSRCATAAHEPDPAVPREPDEEHDGSSREHDDHDGPGERNVRPA